MNDCIFCKIVKGEIPSSKVYEDDDVLAFLDIAPVNLGHVLVIPKNHYENLLDLPGEEVIKVMAVIKKIAPAILASMGSSGFNLNLNNGSSAGQVVGHVHFHIVPRFSSDGLELWGGGKYEDGKAQAVADKIKKYL